MKTYFLSIADEPTDRAVRAALADLLDQRLVTLEAADDALPQLTEAAIEHDVLRARPQPGISLAEAKARFGLWMPDHDGPSQLNAFCGAWRAAWLSGVSR